eukprot:519259-Pyramimonas_sp.AAC.1
MPIPASTRRLPQRGRRGLHRARAAHGVPWAADHVDGRWPPLRGRCVPPGHHGDPLALLRQGQPRART